MASRVISFRTNRFLSCACLNSSLLFSGNVTHKWACSFIPECSYQRSHVVAPFGVKNGFEDRV